MRKSGAILCVILLAMCLVPVLGCRGQSGPPTYRVQGKVTFNGKPLASGEIVFYPDTLKGNQGPGGSAKIVDGVFDTKNGRNPIGGPHRVVVNGYDDPPNHDRDPMPLFPSFTVNQDLPREDTTLDIDVPAKGTTGK